MLALIAWGCLHFSRKIDNRWSDREQKIRLSCRPDELFCREQFIGFRFADRQIFLGNNVDAHSYDFSQITKCELIQNDVAIASADRGSQIVGALAGGIAFGAAGAIIGGLSGSQTIKQNIKMITLKVIVDDPAHPIHEICFFAAQGKGVSPSLLTRKALELANRFHAHCQNAMR